MKFASSATQLVAQQQFWWTLALAPLLLFPHRFPAWLWVLTLLLMALPWAARAFTRTSANLFELLALLFLLWHLPSFLATVDPVTSLEKFSQNLVGLGIACGLIAGKRTPTQLKRLIFLAGLGTATVALITPMITDWTWPAKLTQVIPGWLLRSPWRFAEDVNPNVLGGLMVLMFPVILGLFVSGFEDFSAAPRMTRWACSAALLAVSAMLLLSQARGGYVATAAAMLLFAYLLGGKWRWAAAGGLYAILAGILWAGADQLKNLLAGSAIVHSWDVRAELWSRATYMIQDFSFTGVGLGMYGKVASVLYPFFLISPDVEIGHAHHLLLQVAVDLGIPGLVIYLALLAHAVSRPGTATAYFPGEKPMRIGLYCGMAALLVHGLLDCTLWSNKLAPAPWFVLGMLVALSRERRGYLKRWEVIVWWVLISLLSISFVGDHFGVSLAIAIAGGVLIGLFS